MPTYHYHASRQIDGGKGHIDGIFEIGEYMKEDDHYKELRRILSNKLKCGYEEFVIESLTLISG